MSIKIGVAPIAWSNDDMPELGGETTLEQCLHEARKAGFSGIESGGKFPKDSKILIPKLEKEKIKLCSGWYGAKLLTRSIKDELKEMKQQLELFKDCDAPCMVFAEVTKSIQSSENVPLSKRPILSNDDWKNLIYKINELSKIMWDHGMPLAYHHHMGTVIQSEADTYRLIENTKDTVKLLIDTGHMLFAGGDYLKITKDLNQRIIHVHCKDMRKKILDESIKNDYSFRKAFLEGAFTVPGDGCIDYKPFLSLLREKNYSGWLVVEAEQDPAKANPYEYSKKGFDYLFKTAKECGLEIIS